MHNKKPLTKGYFDEQQKTAHQSISSSSTSSNAIEKKTGASSVDSEIQYYRNKTEIINLSKAELFKQVEFRKKALSKRGVEFVSKSIVSALRKIVDENKEFFITFTSSKAKK